MSVLNAENQINLFNSIKNFNSVKTINTLDSGNVMDQDIIFQIINYFKNLKNARFPEFNQDKLIEKFQTLQ